MSKKKNVVDPKEESRKEKVDEDVQIVDVSNFFNYQRALLKNVKKIKVLFSLSASSNIKNFSP